MAERKGYAAFSRKKNNNQGPNEQLLKHPEAPPLAVLQKYVMLINQGQDDQMEICGFKPNRFKTFLTYLGIILTAGFLRIFFHWLPHLYLKAKCNPCEITLAKFVLITELFNKKHKTYYVKSLRSIGVKDFKCQEDDIQVTKLSVHFENGIFKQVDEVLTFTCKKVIYIYDVEKLEFTKLRGLDHGVSSEVIHRNWGLSKTEQYIRRALYGPNEIIVKESTILMLLFLEVLNPYYIFQIFSFLLWFIDDYIFYACAILLMSLYGIATSIVQTRRNQRNLKSRVHSSDVATVLRAGTINDGFDYEKSETISSDLLVPGDILEIPQHGCIMHCDALLLTGNCILNESMLTGESVPVTKTPFPNIPNIYFDAKEHARHTLFCGTKVIQTRYFGNEKVLAVVIRTGFSTAKGGLVRSILYPPPVDFRFEKDSYRFVMMLAGIAGIGFVYTIVTKSLRGVPVTDLIVEALDLITIVVPPSLPAAMTIGRMHADSRLQKNQIFCISPRSINVAGSIDCVCFDKTGTLTEDGLDLLCVVPVSDQTFEHPVEEVDKLPSDVFLHGLVSCHSLTIIDKQITGDPLDVKMFESTKWLLEEPDVSDNSKFDMIFPTWMKPPPGIAENDCEIGIIREFPFSSSAQRMGVIIRRLEAQNFEYYSKGSPEMILNFVKRESIPHNFSEVLEKYTQEGYRVIALAHKELKITYPKAQKIQREVIEKDMNFLGLIVLENRLKKETTPSITKLNEADIRVIMVTGDNILTAISVARDCGIIKPKQSVITVNVDTATSPPEVYYTLTNTKNEKNDTSVLSNSSSVVSLDTIESQVITDRGDNHQIIQNAYNNYRFAMTGKVWTVLKDDHPELIPRLITRGSIFARMAPEQKQQLVQELQDLGYYVAMCGDGANDCGALKAAHTGISLSDAESSIASPFTSKNPDIMCVLDVIKEGRAALVTSFGLFKYMAAYSLCQFISVMILYSIDSNLTDIEFLYIDLFIIAVFAFFFGSTSAYKGKLVKETPLNSLISLSPVLSLLMQMILVILFQVLSFEHVQTYDWFVPFNSTGKDDKDSVACVENYTIFTISSFQYIILAIVFSKGKPYRESIFTNYGIVISTFIVLGCTIYLAIEPFEWLREFFELIMPKTYDFRVILLAYAACNFVLSILIEVLLIEHCVFKKLRFKFHNVHKSKRKYLAIESELSSSSKWPTLTNYRSSTTSPTTPQAFTPAEIVIESEKFDKNHVLNSFYKRGENDAAEAAENVQALEAAEIQDVYASSEFQSAINLAASDVSFKTAENSCSLPNTPGKFQQLNGNITNSEPHLYLKRRLRTLSSESEDASYNNVFNGNGNVLPTGKYSVMNLEMNEIENR